MKPKKLKKRLSLNKRTIATLRDYEKKFVKGGEPATIDTDCGTCVTECGTCDTCDDPTCATCSCGTCYATCPTDIGCTCPPKNCA